MTPERTPCCLVPSRGCGTRFSPLLALVVRMTGKAVRLVSLDGDEQGRAPFFAQPVGFDGRAFFVAHDHGCDTEKLLHELCHWLVAPRERRGRPNYGLGPGPVPRGEQVPPPVRDNEEVTVMLLERLLAPHFALPESKLARPDYNVANRRNIDWSRCEEWARAFYAELLPRLPEGARRERVDARVARRGEGRG